MHLYTRIFFFFFFSRLSQNITHTQQLDDWNGGPRSQYNSLAKGRLAFTLRF